jgi:hypothetical protein
MPMTFASIAVIITEKMQKISHLTACSVMIAIARKRILNHAKSADALLEVRRCH